MKKIIFDTSSAFLNYIDNIKDSTIEELNSWLAPNTGATYLGWTINPLTEAAYQEIIDKRKFPYLYTEIKYSALNNNNIYIFKLCFRRVYGHYVKIINASEKIIPKTDSSLRVPNSP